MSAAGCQTTECIDPRAGAAPPVDATLPQLGDEADARPPAGDGRFRVLHAHARGGLGEVFVAEDTHLRRHVALKEIQSWLADDAGSRARFVREAEITGGLEHPGVVPVYALGRYDDGRPYYAMRFVRGGTLDDAVRAFHADDGGFDSPTFRNLLRRFVDVCNAIAYAHSRGVVHRDIKPGNVMLGEFGETLVVDWGLACEIGERPAGSPRQHPDVGATHAGQAIGTPAYMSPEQAAGQRDRVGPASDTYSLGATLYEILTGRPPFVGVVPVVLDSVRSGDYAPPRVVSPAVPRPLEAVCAKAMALRPDDRYATPLDLAADIERWLADEPVTAWSEPAYLRAGRWLRRHQTAVAAGIAVLLAAAVALAVGLAAVSAERAATARERDEKQAALADVTRERDAAREQRRRTRQALDTMLSEEMVERLGTQKELAPAQAAFLRKALDYYREFAAEAGDGPAGRVLEARAHVRVTALLRGLGRREEAVAPLHTALGLFAQLATEQPGEPAHRIALAEVHNVLGALLDSLGRHDASEEEYKSALRTWDRLAADHPATPGYRQELARGRSNLAVLLRKGRRPKDAETLHRSALALREALAAEAPKNASYRLELSESHNNLAVLLDDLSRVAEAEAHYRAALAVRKEVARSEPAAALHRHRLAASHNNLGAFLEEYGRRVEAEPEYRASLALFGGLAAEFPAVPEYALQLGGTRYNLARLLRATGRPAEALGWYTSAATLLDGALRREPTWPAARSYLSVCLRDRAETLALLGRTDEAFADWSRALEFDDGSSRNQIRLGQALAQAKTGRKDEAVRTAAELADAATTEPADLTRCASAFAAAGEPERAVATLRRALAAGDEAAVLADSAFDALRGRADFAELVWAVADGPTH